MTLLLAMPSVKSKATLRDRAFTAAAPSLSNSLPSELYSITCVDSFKAHLRPIFLDMHILNRDFNNTFAKYLSTGSYHTVRFLNLLGLAISLVRYYLLFFVFII